MRSLPLRLWARKEGGGEEREREHVRTRARSRSLQREKVGPC
jgi:hypothetical protein